MIKTFFEQPCNGAMVRKDFVINRLLKIVQKKYLFDFCQIFENVSFYFGLEFRCVKQTKFVVQHCRVKLAHLITRFVCNTWVVSL